MTAGRRGCRTLRCTQTRREQDLLCASCWARVPEPIRADILRRYKPGSIRQTPKYFVAVRTALDAAEAGRP